MILTDYYQFSAITGQKSKYRRDCNRSTGNYLPLEQLRNKEGRLFLYLTHVPDCFNDRIKSRADMALTKTVNISSLRFPDLEQNFAFGDFNGTADALLFVVKPDYSGFELFIARGQKYNQQALCSMLAAGELDEEIERLRQAATKEAIAA